MNPTRNFFDKWNEAFLLSAGILLGGAALIRFLIVFNDSQILNLPDASFGIPIRTAVLVVGIVELVMCLICLFNKSICLRTMLLTLFMTVWAISRNHLTHLGIDIRGTCFGLLTNPLRISNPTLERVFRVAPDCLLVITYVSMGMVGVYYRKYFSMRRSNCGANGDIINRGIPSYINTGILLFVFLTGVLLLAAALVQFMIAAGDSQVLTLPDAVLGIQLRFAVILVGAVELTVGLFCVFGKSVDSRVVLITWLLTNWAVYHIALTYMGINSRYSCVGLVTDPLRISVVYWYQVQAVLPIALLFGTYVALSLSWINQRGQRSLGYIKVACLGCGGHIEFPVNTISWKIACPHCGGGVRLQSLPVIV